MVGAAIKTPVPSSSSSPSMNKPRPNTPQREVTRRAGRPALFLRIIISLILVWHLTAVTLAPFSVALSMTRFRMVPFEIAIAQRPPMQWYLDALYLNHGYHFFAPDPGEGHLIRYEVFNERGEKIKESEFPNRKEQWPRLLYHRYFMLADQAQLMPGDEQTEAYWQRNCLEAYARNLLRETDGQSIRLKRMAHYPLLPEHAMQGRKLDDPETYQEIMKVEQRRTDERPPVPAAATDQSGKWQGGRPTVPSVASPWTSGGRR